ncbi:MAG: hypothetical protein ACRDMJ_04005, partial [Solirubrobacteraceae bacterium]
MPRAGESRSWLLSRLNAAYGDGLLSDDTFARRMDAVLGGAVVQPAWLVGDLTLRDSRTRLYSEL